MAKSPDQLNKELKEFIKALTESFNIFAVVLYGSYAVGRTGEYSDIDIAVFSEDFGENLFEDMKKLFKLRRKIDPDIEPLPFRKRDYFEYGEADFLKEILSKGKVIYKEGEVLI
jgi:predicted nucleotidyltransferase